MHNASDHVHALEKEGAAKKLLLLLYYRLSKEMIDKRYPL